MKVLHTSDWHIGRKLYENSLDRTLSYFFKWLKNIIVNKEIDVLIVAGDIFNNPFPSSSSLSLYYRVLYELSRTNLKHIIITGGNHDSVSTLNAPKDLLEVLNISVVGGFTGNYDDLIIEIKENNKIQLVVCAVPFLRERDIRKSFSGNDFKERVKQVSAGISNFYEEIGKRILKYKEKNIPVVATGHLFVNDISQMPEQEKELFIGGLQQISYNQIPDYFDYYAFGHIHKPYKIADKENVRYCGSPIDLNFSERNFKNLIIIVDFKEKTEITPVEVPVFRELVHFKGTFNEVKKEIENYQNKSELNAWADIDIIEEKTDPAIEVKLNNLKENTKNIEIIKFKYIFKDVETDIENKFRKNINLKDLQPTDVFDSLLEMENLVEKEKESLKETFNDLLSNYLYEQ